MLEVQYALREEEKNITLLTMGMGSACQLCQICFLSKREIAPVFLGKLLGLDIKSSQFPPSAYADSAKSISVNRKHRYYYAFIDSQIEFTAKSRVMQMLTEFLPSYTGTGLSRILNGQPYGFLVVLRVYRSEYELPEEMLQKGRQGSAQIIRLYDETGYKDSFVLDEELTPVVENGAFEQIKEEIVHSLKIENALVGVYGGDERSAFLLQQKRDLYNDSFGQYKWEYNEETEIDRATIDYEAVYSRAVNIDPGMNDLVNSLRAIKPPQMAELQMLFAKTLNGDLVARKRLMEMYLRNVLRMAVDYSERYGFCLADAFQEGVLGLMTAIEKFNSSESGSFRNYFPFWVRRSILRNLPPMECNRYYPVHIHVKMLFAQDALREYGQSVSEDYAEIVVNEKILEIVAEKAEVSIESAKKLLKYMKNDISYESFRAFCRTNRPNRRLEPYVEDNEAVEILIFRDQRKMVSSLLSKLREKERDVIILRHGLYGYKTHTLEEIAKKYSVTRERIRQIEAKAMKKMYLAVRKQELEGLLD